MARGGKRDGAGRKAGAANQRTREIADAAAAQGITPLEYMLGVMRDGNADIDRRDAMARAAAPYMHPSLKSVEHHGAEDKAPIRHRVEQHIVDAANDQG